MLQSMGSQRVTRLSDWTATLCLETAFHGEGVKHRQEARACLSFSQVTGPGVAQEELRLVSACRVTDPSLGGGSSEDPSRLQKRKSRLREVE